MRVSNGVAVGSPMARLTMSAAAGLALAVVLAGAVLGAASPSPAERSWSCQFAEGASPSPSLPAAGLVTEDVEPGVERIISDGAGHDLDEKHPTSRYDMDDVFVAPDGTVWLSTSYSGTDNDANGPGGGLVWAVGQPDTARYPGDGPLCFRGTFDNPGLLGVTCYDLVAGTETKYLAGTQINAVAVAPDGTFWAVGGDGAENGGLYHITPE